MTELFSIEDLFNAIISLEGIGNRNYKRLAEQAHDAELKAYFSTLAEMELKHKMIFESLQAKVVTFPHEEMDASYRDYLGSLLSHTLRFVNLFEVQMVNPEVYEDFDMAFDLAVGLEKDVILFLSEMKHILDSHHHPVLNQLLDEERSHLKYLYDYRTSSGKTSNGPYGQL